MAERWCPQCRGEFRAGITMCDVDLERAAAYLDAADAGAVGMVSDEELAAQAEAAAGFSDPSRGAVV